MLNLKKWMTKVTEYIAPTVKTSGVVLPASGYTVRYQNCRKQGNMVQLSFAINKGGTALTSGRTDPIATIASGWRPIDRCYCVIPAGASINGALARSARLIIQSTGNVALDNQANTDVKEISCTVIYMGA